MMMPTFAMLGMLGVMSTGAQPGLAAGANAAALAPVTLLQAAAPAAQTEEVMYEIVVIGRELKKWRGNWRIRNGNVLCRTKKSTGDKKIDAIGCAALVQCVQPRAPELIAARNSDRPKADRRREVDRIIMETVPCTARVRQAGINALAEARKGKTG